MVGVNAHQWTNGAENGDERFVCVEPAYYSSFRSHIFVQQTVQRPRAGKSEGTQVFRVKHVTISIRCSVGEKYFTFSLLLESEQYLWMRPELAQSRITNETGRRKKFLCWRSISSPFNF